MKEPFPFPDPSQYKSPDEAFMWEALKEAWKAFCLDEVPVGAVVVLDGAIIARAYNEVESTRKATRHAELSAIEKAEQWLGNWRLERAVLYTTLEPCPMCAGAAVLSRVDRIVYGARDIRQGAHGSFIDLFAEKHPIHNVKIEGGIFQEEAKQLMQLFFRRQRARKSK